MKTRGIVAFAALMFCASVAYGQNLMPLPDPGPSPVPPAPYQSNGIPIYSPIPIQVQPGVPAPIYSHPAPLSAVVAAAPTFTRVKYTDVHEKAPCAQTKLIRAMNPCKRCCTDPDCVTIKICVPGCGCERVKVRSKGKRVRYDYGKYAVDVRVKNGYIEVDYQD